jgi:hypothetical protein
MEDCAWCESLLRNGTATGDMPLRRDARAPVGRALGESI